MAATMDSFGVNTAMRWPCLSNLKGHFDAGPLTIDKGRLYRSQIGEDALLYAAFFNTSEFDCRASPSSCKPHPPAYLELGANNGVSMSNSYFFEEALGWHGLLIEAEPKYCDQIVNSRCAKERAWRGPEGIRNVLACGAVCKASDGGSVELVKMDAMSGVPSMGMYETHLDMKINAKRMQGREVIPCAPMNALLSKAGLHRRRIDLFSLDVEGAELHVLNTIDWSTFRFGVLILEISCIDDPRGPLQNQTRALLWSKGYTFIKRHNIDEIWGDMSLEYVRKGALKLNGGVPQRPMACGQYKPPKPAARHFGFTFPSEYKTQPVRQGFVRQVHAQTGVQSRPFDVQHRSGVMG